MRLVVGCGLRLGLVRVLRGARVERILNVCLLFTSASTSSCIYNGSSYLLFRHALFFECDGFGIDCDVLLGFGADVAHIFPLGFFGGFFIL